MEFTCLVPNTRYPYQGSSVNLIEPRKKQLRINQKVTIHGLRHSFATNAISNGCNIIAVSKHLGHSKIDITLNTYSHLLEQTDAEMLNIIEKLSKS
ncbi:tyrosine-type recombinase/integrase [Solobacterium moorei]